MEPLFSTGKQRIAHVPKHSAVESTSSAKSTGKVIKPKGKSIPGPPQVLASGTVINSDGSLPVSTKRRGRPKKQKKPICSSDEEDDTKTSSWAALDEADRAAVTATKRGRKYKSLNEVVIYTDAVIQAAKQAAQLEDERKKKNKGRVHMRNPEKDDAIRNFFRKCFEPEDNEDDWMPDTYYRDDGSILDWDDYLQKYENLINIPPVTSFKQTPLYDQWTSIAIVGLGIELKNPFADDPENAYWLGTITYYAGYKALVTFESFGSQPGTEYVSWISFCSDVPKHLGWCQENGINLTAGPVVAASFPDEIYEMKLKEFYTKPTISRFHLLNIQKRIHECNKKVPHLVEAMDLHILDENRVGKTTGALGNRVRVSYLNETEEGKFESREHFWYNTRSERLHEFGWSHTIGVTVNATGGNRRFDLPRHKFPEYPDNISIKPGLLLETRHPTRPGCLVGAAVLKVFRYGFFSVQTHDKNPRTRVRYLYHITSPFVLPVGFGASHGIEVDWSPDLKNGPTLDLHLLPSKPSHDFIIGMKVEAVDILHSQFMSPATVRNIAGHLLLINFDNFPDVEKNYHWVDTETSDIYPIGYCEMLSLKFNGHVSVK